MVLVRCIFPPHERILSFPENNFGQRSLLHLPLVIVCKEEWPSEKKLQFKTCANWVRWGFHFVKIHPVPDRDIKTYIPKTFGHRKRWRGRITAEDHFKGSTGIHGDSKVVNEKEDKVHKRKVQFYCAGGTLVEGGNENNPNKGQNCEGTGVQDELSNSHVENNILIGIYNLNS